MSEMKTISFRMKGEVVESLDALAETMDRDRSYLLNEAVERYLELNEYHVQLIEKGLRAAQEGQLVSHADVKKMINEMGRSMMMDTKQWFAAMDRLRGDGLLKGGRKQPRAPRRKIFE
jgi:predicted transcriptional regulator